MAFFWFRLQTVQDDRLWIIIFLDPLVPLKIPFKMHQIFIFRVFDASAGIFSVKAPTLTNHTNKLNNPPLPVTLKRTPENNWKNQNQNWPAPLPPTRWHILTRALHFLYLLNHSPTPTTSLSLSEPRETKITLWMGSTGSRLQSHYETEIPGVHLTELGRIKAWVNLGAIQ